MAGEEEVLNVNRHEHGLHLVQELHSYKCSGCRGRGANIGYKCRLCPDFVLHRACAALPDEHVHPFFPRNPFNFRPNTRLRHDCDACGFLLRGFVFQSNKGLRFHPLCMDLPKEFTYSGHPDHRLELVLEKGGHICTRCNGAITNWKYRCTTLNCGVNLDMNCAIMDFHRLSGHGFTQVYKPSKIKQIKHAMAARGVRASRAVGGVLLEATGT